MKNIDKIREMDSEELAELLEEDKCKHCNYGCYKSEHFTINDCFNGIIDWMETETKPTLTEDEKVILRNLDKKYKWIARDGNDDLHIYVKKPYKVDPKIDDYWQTPKEWAWLDIYKHLFKFIKYQDDEPYNIKELLEEKII